MFDKFDTEPKVPEFVRTVLSKAVEGLSEKDEFKSLTESERTMAAVVAVQAARDVIGHLRHKKMYSASNWLVAGAIAFIFSMILDPTKFFETYGVVQTKVAFLLFSISIFYGVQNSWASSTMDAFEESDTLKTLATKIFEFDAAKNSHKEQQEKNDKGAIELEAAESVVKTIIQNLAGTREFWIQICGFGLGLGIFLISFLIK